MVTARSEPTHDLHASTRFASPEVLAIAEEFGLLSCFYDVPSTSVSRYSEAMYEHSLKTSPTIFLSGISSSPSPPGRLTPVFDDSDEEDIDLSDDDSVFGATSPRLLLPTAVSQSRSPPSSPSSSRGSPKKHRTPSHKRVTSRLEQRPVPEGSEYLQPTLAKKCPVCGYTSKGSRLSDVRRHILSHYTTALPVKWFCCGVPVGLAADYGVPGDMMRAAKFYDETKQWMVGGCGERFARRDHYMRHLDALGARCYGDANGDWVPGDALADGNRGRRSSL